MYATHYAQERVSSEQYTIYYRNNLEEVRVQKSTTVVSCHRLNAGLRAAHRALSSSVAPMRREAVCAAAAGQPAAAQGRETLTSSVSPHCRIISNARSCVSPAALSPPIHSIRSPTCAAFHEHYYNLQLNTRLLIRHTSMSIL